VHPARANQLDVLLVEDNPADARLVAEYLRDVGSPVALTHARHLAHAVEQLRRRGFHAILLDLSLPDCQGIDTFARAHAAAPDAPIVVLTGLDDEEMAVRAVREGAQDYLVKDRVDGHLLHHSIRYAIERKRAQQDLHEREERLRQIVENIHEVFFIVHPNFRETFYVSPAFETLWGRSCRSAYDDPGAFLAGVVPGDRKRLQADAAHVQRGGESTGVEFRVARPDGQVVWVLAHVSPVHDEQGRVHRIAGVALDITRRIQAERAVHESEQRLRTLFETVNLIVLGLDARGRVDYVNPYFLRLTGYTADEVLGQPWIETFLPEHVRADLDAAFRELSELEANPHFRNPILTRDGRERMISWHNTVVRDADGRGVGTLSVGEDVTEHELLERQFRQAQKMEAIGRLAGGVAHDFNNLLTVITGYSNLLLTALSPGSPHRSDVEAISDAAGKAASLTRQLLAFSRQQVLAPSILNVNDVVRGSQRMLQRLLGEDLHLVISLDSELGSVRADAGQLEQVLLNLAVNARDAMPDGGSLTIETANVELSGSYTKEHLGAEAGPHVLLAVSDTGVGMDAATQARIFEPFFTTKPAGKGTGLGLATVYGIVEQSGGFLWVYSEPGKGTTFKVYLPMTGATVADLPPAASGPVRGGDETVLLVEDAAPVRAVARETLERYGYAVIEAPAPDVALELVARTPHTLHLLVTDVVMPGMNGRQLAARITSERPDIRVLFMSGYTDDSVMRSGVLEHGMPYLQKPFTPEGLARKVREVLDASPGERSST
jgi:PAS domain S-box-containing protein